MNYRFFSVIFNFIFSRIFIVHFIKENYKRIFLFLIVLLVLTNSFSPSTTIIFTDPDEEFFISATPFYTFNFSYTGTQDVSIFLDFDDTLVTYINFENVSGTTVIDNSVYGRNATLIGGASVVSTNSIRGDNVNIGANTHGVQLDTISQSIDDFSISFWFRSNNAISSGSVPNFVFYESDSIDIYFIQTQNGRLLFQDGAFNFLSTRNSWLANEWYHIVVSYNSSNDNLSMFINGDLDATTTRSSVSIDASSTHNFGRWIFGTGYRGRLDELMIFNRTITPSEVLGLYDGRNNDVSAFIENLADGVFTYRGCSIDESGDFSCTPDRFFEVFDGPIPVEISFENNFTNQETLNLTIESFLAQNMQFSCDNETWSSVFLFDDFRINSNTAIFPLQITDTNLGCSSSEGLREIFINVTGVFDPGFDSTTITYDITPPTIFDVTPLDGAIISTSITNFQFQVNDTLSPINNCILFIDGVQDGDIEFSIPQDTPFTFSRNSTDIGLGDREFAISCQDEAGNSQVIQPREFLMAVEAPDIQNLTFSTQRAGFGEEVVIELIVPEPFGGYDTVFFEITPQSGAPFTITPTLISSDTFRHIYTQTWEEGVVNVYAFVNTTGGLFDEIESNFTINSSLQASIFTSRDSYLQGEIIDLTSSFSWFDTDWNYRFLNILEPQQIFRNSIIFNERINFSQKLEQRNEFGNININSIRIIEYDSSGSPIMFDSTRIGDERFFIDYEVSGDDSSQYDGVINAVLDISFALEDEIEINQERYFMIYFDIEENGAKPTSSSQIDNIVFPISCNNPFVKTTDDTGAHYFIPINDDGTFGNEEFLFSNGDRIRGEAIADFSGDGNCDFLYFSNSQNRFFGVRQTDEYVFSQPFDLNITSPSPSMSGWQMDMAVGDFTNNYFQDVITSGNNRRLYILRNNGDFDFSASLITTSAPGSQGRCKDSGDLNNNGILDFIYGSTSDDGNIYAYFGNGDGTFQAPVLIASALTGNNQMYGCALGYFNEDNYLDLAVIGGNSGDTYLFTSNDGSGTSFTNQGIVFSFGRDGALASYDVNKNGFDDLLVATWSLQSIRFYENNQDETFTLNSEIGNSFALGIGAPESRSQGDIFTINSVQLVPDNLDFSTIFNELTNEENFYSRLEVEFFSSGSWSFYDVIYDDFSSSLTTLFRNSTFSIRDKYINEGGFDSSGVPLGNYRFRLLLKDDSNDVLISDSTELEFFSNVFNISVDSNPPTFNVISYTPEITGYGDAISFNTFVTDFTGVDVVYVNITLPDSSVETLVLNPSSVNNYVNTFSNTWQRGVYNLVFFANDTLSNTRVVSGESFEITSNLALNMATTKDEYFVGEIVDITSAFSWVDNNWNFRIPVTLDSTQKRRFNALLENEYNFTQILSDLGISGTFSQNSLRVVEFDSLGDPIIYNSSNTGIDRYSIPFNIELSNEFEPTDNALVKVSFFAQGQTLGNEQRNFQIFFDIEENGIKSSAINLNTLPLPNFDLDGSGTQKLIFGHEAQRLLIYNPVTDNVEFQSAPHRRYAQLGYGDLRNTGTLEILYGGQDSNIWSYQYNEITNIFEQTGSFGFVRYGLSVGDVTGDGVQNLVTGLNQNNILNVYEFDGSSYQLIEDIPLAVFGGTNPRNLAVGDFNQNGRDEIAVLGYTNGNWFGILEYDEATDDYDMVYFLDLPGTAVGLGFYDTSGNGMPNIWFGGSSGQVYNVEFNDITEEYELVWQTNIGGAWVGSFDFADFNNNGRTNIVTSRNTGRQVVVFEYDNQGGYDEIYTSNVLPNAQRDGLVPMFIDFNGDGELGVAIGGRNGYIEFFDIGNPDPVFSRQFNPPGTNRVAAHFGSSMLVMGRGDPRGIQYPYISDITIGFAEERSQSPEKSFVRNIGSTLTFSYTNFEIEFYNETTSSWESVVIIFDGASSSEINSGLGVGGLFSLRDEFINRGSFNSTGFEPGLYRINFAFTDPFGNVLENSDLSLVQTSYEFNLTLDESGPDILGSIVSPNITGVGDFVTIQVDAQDFSGIDRVWANITYPDSSTMMLDLNQITTLRYQLQFNNTWQRGEYEVEIYLNDTNGFLSSVNYTFEIVGDVDISIATLENLYFPDSLVDLTSPFSWWVTDWNYRIPLILEASNAPRPYVLLRQEVDFTQSLAEISELGIFDINSIRVVEYDVFGNPVVYNSSRSGDDRFIIPTRFTPASDFSATTNAAGILEFKVEGPIPANTQRNYLIYFDIEENGIKSPPYRSFTPPKEFLAYVRETGIGAVIEYTGTGSTGFASQSIFGSFSSSNDRSRGIVIADFTNNGMFDIVFGGSGGSLFADLKFFEQTAPMNFVDRGITSQNSIFANSFVMDLVAGDFNNNGNMDLIFSGNNNQVYFIPGNGDGTFGQEQLVYNDLGNIRGKTVGDFTGNGNLDVIFTMSGSSGRFILLRGEGDGTFVEVSLFNPPSNNGYCLTGGDFNNNGFLDLFYDPRASSTSYFFAGDGTGGFSSPQSLFSVPDFSGCDAYDFNRDGNLDVYMVIRDGDVLEHRGFGDGTFQTPAQATVLGTPDSRTFAISAPNTFEFETSTFNIQTRADSSIPSRILNNINAVTRPYINLSVEFYNETTTSWEFYDVLVDTLQQAIFENSLLDLRTYYETFGRWNTTNSQSGLYSVVLRLEDNVGNILTNISGQDYMKRFNFTITTDVEGPTYNNFVITPENVGYNQSVSFRVDVLDESGVDSVWANITTPSGQSIRVDLEQFFGARYVFDNYSPTWEFGDYNITIFANDTLSQLSNISQIFRVSAISDISMNVGRFSYFSNSTVDITNSFILNSDFTNYSFYLEMGVERFNTTSSTWELFEVVIDNLHLLNKTSISTNENINLVSIWDAVGRWNTTDSLGGFYRIYTRLVDNESNTLLQNDSIPLFQTTPAFNVLNISGATIINNYQIEPQTLGLGRTSTIQINVSSTAGIDTVWANITNPNAVEERFEFTNIIDDLYELNFSNTWINGEYNITIFANNTNSDLVSVDDILTVFTQADVNVKTIEDIYFDDNIVLLDSSSSWWDIDWKYRLPVTLNEESGRDLENYFTYIELDTQTLISQGRVNENGSDIRIIDENNNELISQIDLKTLNTPSTRVWFETNLSNSGSRTVFVYYGNPLAQFPEYPSRVSSIVTDSATRNTIIFDDGWEYRTSTSYGRIDRITLNNQWTCTEGHLRNTNSYPSSTWTDRAFDREFVAQGPLFVEMRFNDSNYGSYNSYGSYIQMFPGGVHREVVFMNFSTETTERLSYERRFSSVNKVAAWIDSTGNVQTQTSTTDFLFEFNLGQNWLGKYWEEDVGACSDFYGGTVITPGDSYFRGRMEPTTVRIRLESEEETFQANDLREITFTSFTGTGGFDGLLEVGAVLSQPPSRVVGTEQNIIDIVVDSNYSGIRNEQTLDFDSYIFAVVQRDIAGTWTNVETIINNEFTTIDSSAFKDISKIWIENGNFSTLSRPLGEYRVLVELRDNVSNLLFNNDSTPLNATYNFEIVVDTFPSVVEIDIVEPEIDGYGQEFRFDITIVDNSLIDTVELEITQPNGTIEVIPLNNITFQRDGILNRYTYNATYSNTWQLGEYEFRIFAEDELGNSGFSSPKTFEVSSSALIVVQTNQLEYAENVNVLLTSTSRIENIGDYNFSGFIEAAVEFYNETTMSWEEIILINLTEIGNLTNFSTAQNVNLQNLWANSIGWNTTGAITGNYSIDIRITDPDRTILLNDDFSNMSTRFIFEVNTDDIIPPVISNITLEPELLGFGANTTLMFRATDNGVLDTVLANITLPDLQVLTFIPLDIGDDTFRLEINESWLNGVHNIVIFANDSAGNSATNTTSYLVQSNVTGSVATIEENYEHNEIVKLNSPFEWFNESWNYRVPIKFDEFSLDRFDLVQQIEINFTQIIEQLGFIANFDENSLRLVEYFENGSMKVYNDSISDNNRFVAGMRILPTQGFNTLNNAAYRFDIRLDGITPANTQRTFMMYFDIEENGIKDEFEVPLNQSQLIAVLTELNGRYRTAKINEDGTFGSFDYWGFALSTNNAGAAVADYTNSGAYDIVHGGNFRLFFAEQTGDNIFTSRGPIVPGGWMPNDWIMGMASGDFNHNGFKDFVVGGNNNIYFIGFGNGDGTFTTQSIDTTGLSGNSRGKDAGDITNNGILDVVASHTNGRVYAFINDGEGNFTTSEVLNAGSNNAYCLTLGDFTGDGNVDIIMDTGNFADNEYRLYTGNGDGSFNPSGTVLFSVNLRSGCDSYDINNNGYLDLLFIDDRTDVYVAYGNGDGTFQTPELVFAHPDNHQSRDISLPNMPLQYSYSLFDIEEVASIQIPSLFFNEGVTDTEFQLVITIDYFNEGTSAWELFDTIVNETSYSTLFTGQSIDLSREFSQAGNWNTSTFDFGLYRVNAYLLGERGILESSNPSTLMQVFSEFNITPDITPPEFTSINIEPEIIGFGETFGIQVNFDDTDTDTAIASITKPDSSIVEIELSQESSFRFVGTFNDTWLEGEYIFTILANDTAGNEATPEILIRTVQSNITLSIATLQDLYFENQLVELSSPFTWFNDTWNYRFLITQNATNTVRGEVPVRNIINFTQKLQDLDLLREFNIESIRVIEYSGSGNPIPYSPTQDFIPVVVSEFDISTYDEVENAVVELRFNSPGFTEPNQERYFMVYFDTFETSTLSSGPTKERTTQGLTCRNPFVKASDDLGQHFITPINEDGTFGTSFRAIRDSRRSRAGAVADFTGNGYCDFTYTEVDDRIQYIVEQIGDYEFADPIQIATIPTVSAYEMGTSAGDFNGNGNMDIVFVGNNRNIRLLTNQGNNVFTLSTITTDAPRNGRCMASGDLNGNGILDFIYGTDSGDSNIYAYFGNGDGTFQSPIPIASVPTGNNDFYGCTVGYFNNDDHLDLMIIGGSSGDTYLFTSDDGSGVNFTNQGLMFDLTSHAGIASYDINKDGFDDVTVIRTGRGVRYYQNNQDESFTQIGGDLNSLGGFGMSLPERFLGFEEGIVGGAQRNSEVGGSTLVFNSGITTSNVFVNVYVEYFNESISTWELVETIIEDTTPRELISENLIDIQNLYNQAGAFNTSTNPLGEYRVVLELQDNVGNTLVSQSSPLTTNYEFILDIDTTPPFIDNIIVDPQIGGFDNEILLQAFVTDISDSIESVWVDITYPDSSTQRVDLVPITDIIYRGFFNDTWRDGLYLVNFFANDTNGNLNNTIPTLNFTIESNVSMSLATLQSEYLNAEIVELTSPFEWWDNNWNYRRLVIVDESDVLRIEPLISLDIDFTQELLQFNSLNEFDINSIRIIEYRGDGTLLEFDNTLSGSERFIVPRQITPNAGFNNLSNADVNIEFNVPGITQPDEVRFFMIYFDDNELGTKPEQVQTQITKRAPQCLNPFVKIGDETGRHFIARINQETGTVENVVQELFDGRRLRGGAVADFTGNGLCDFTYTQVDERVQYIVEQIGDYEFADPVPVRSVPNMNTFEMGSAAGDFTGNGLIDIIIGGNNRNIYLLENNGNFNFGISTITTTAPGNQGRCKDSGDLNGNGILDFIYGGNSDDGNIYAYFGNGDGTFQAPVLIASALTGNNQMYGCAVGYFTDNNFLDVAVVGGNSGDTFLFTNDDGTATSFTNQGVIISSTNHRSIDAFDVNNNGFDDIIATRWTSNQNRVYLNNGDGSFTFDRQFGPVRSLGLSAPSYALIDTTFTLEPSEVNLFQEIPSFVFNNGNSSFNYFLNISVEYFNETTSSWQLVEEKVDSSIKRTLNLGGLINLRSLFAEAGNFDTTNQEAGQYRVFVRLTDNEQNVLSNGPNVFEISALFNITPDTIAPELFEMNINPNPANVTQQVNVSARAIDNFEVFRVWANVTSPSNIVFEVNLSLDSLTFYSELFNETNELGEYLIQFFAIDFDDNINESEIFELLVLDNIVPNISFVEPTPNESEIITSADGVIINVTSSDDSGISSTFIDFNRSVLAYYNFEDVISFIINDDSTYDNFLFTSNIDIIQDKDSIRGNYLEINPSSNIFMFNNDSINTDLEEMTLSAFINLNSTNDMNIVGKFTGEFGLRVRGGNIEGFFENTSNIVSHPISTNEWNLVTLTYNSSHLRLYINATPMDEVEIGETTSGVGGEFRIGDNTMPTNNFKIDEILLYDRAITTSEILSLNTSLPILEVEFPLLDNGVYNVTGTIIDIGGNINITTRTFEMNITDPLITILSPIDETKYLSNEELNLTIQSDQELQNVYYIINGNESNQIALNSGDLFNWTNKLNFTLGFNTITLRYTSTINRNFERDIIIYIIEAVSKDMVRVIHANSNSDIEFNINSNSELNSTVFVEIDFNYPLNSTRTSDFNFTRNFNDINSTIFGFILNESPTTLNISQFENQALRVNNIFGLG